MNRKVSPIKSLVRRFFLAFVGAFFGGPIGFLGYYAIARNLTYPEPGFQDLVAFVLGAGSCGYLAAKFGDARLEGKALLTTKGAIFGLCGGSLLGCLFSGLFAAMGLSQASGLVFGPLIGLLVGGLCGRLMAGGRVTIREIGIAIVLGSLVCAAGARFIRLGS